MNGFALFLAAFRALAPTPTAPAPVVVSMEDQFEQPVSTADLRGDVVVLIYGDRDSAAANKALGEQLHVAFHPAAKGLSPARAQQAPVRPLPDLPAGARSPDVRTIPVACVGRIGPVIRALVRGQIRLAAPDVPVWLDFADVMKTQFAFAAGVPNVVVLDVDGRPRYAASGRLTAEQIVDLTAVIEGLRREAVGGSR